MTFENQVVKYMRCKVMHTNISKTVTFYPHPTLNNLPAQKSVTVYESPLVDIYYVTPIVSDVGLSSNRNHPVEVQIFRGGKPPLYLA